MRFCSKKKMKTDSPGMVEAKEALQKVEADAPRVEEIRLAHEVRLNRNDFGPKFAAALHLKRTK